MKTMNKFLEDAEFDDEFTERLKSYGEVESLSQLQKFARERWPEQYSKDWRKPMSHHPFGSEAMRILWGKYLNWKETVDID